MSDIDPTGDRTWRGDEEQLTDDLARERFARRAIDQALLDVIEERDRVLAQLVDAMAAGQSMEGQCHDLEDERDGLRKRVDDLELQAGDRERHLRDALKDMRAERDRLRADLGVQTDAADAAAEAVGNMAEKLSTLLAENARLREDLARERWVRLEGDTDRDRLRAVVDAAREVDRRARDAELTGHIVVTPPWFGALRDALAALDVSPNTGGDSDG